MLLETSKNRQKQYFMQQKTA